MKFEIPEIEVKKFDLADILTASGAPGPGPVSVAESDNEGSCTGNDSDWGVPACI